MDSTTTSDADSNQYVNDDNKNNNDTENNSNDVQPPMIEPFPGIAYWTPNGAWAISKNTNIEMDSSHWLTQNSSDTSQSDAIGASIMQPNGDFKCPSDGTYLVSAAFAIADFTSDPAAELTLTFNYHPRNPQAQSPDYTMLSFKLSAEKPIVSWGQRCIMKTNDIISLTIRSTVDINNDEVGHQSILSFKDVTMDNTQVLFNGVTGQPPQYDAGNKISQMQVAPVINGQSRLTLTQCGTETGQSYFQTVLACTNIELFALNHIDTTATPIKTVNWTVQPINPNWKTVDVVVTYAYNGELVNDGEYIVKGRFDGN